MEEAVVNPKDVTESDLRDNSLESLPLEIVPLTSLTTLDLEGNNLTQLPLEIGQLNDLTIFNLSDNNLDDEVKKGIKQLLPNCEISGPAVQNEYQIENAIDFNIYYQDYTIEEISKIDISELYNDFLESYDSESSAYLANQDIMLYILLFKY